MQSRNIEIRLLAKYLFKKMGYLVKRYNIYNDPMVLIMSLLAINNIDVVFDVGANEGQFARRIRHAGYAGRIISFEPVAQVYEKLSVNARGDAKWKTVNCALGSFDGKAQINVSLNTVSSSLLNMLPRHVEAAPDSTVAGQEEISVKQIDSIIDNYLGDKEQVFVKMDVQGFERQIIDGCKQSLSKVCGMQLEMSLVPLYEGEMLMGDMIDLLLKRNYALLSIEPVYRDAVTHEILQMDGIFIRRDLLGSLSLR